MSTSLVPFIFTFGRQKHFILLFTLPLYQNKIKIFWQNLLIKMYVLVVKSYLGDLFCVYTNSGHLCFEHYWHWFVTRQKYNIPFLNLNDSRHIELFFKKTCEMRGLFYFQAIISSMTLFPLRNIFKSYTLKISRWYIIPMKCHLITIFLLCDTWRLLNKWTLAGDGAQGKNNQAISHT